MFAMLSGRWPRTTAAGLDVARLEATAATDRKARDGLPSAIETLVVDAVRAQEAAGLDLITDGQVRFADPAAAVLEALDADDLGADGTVTRAWRATASLTDRTVAQVIPGPYSLGRRVADGEDATTRSGRTIELAGQLARQLRSLQDAGCPMVQVEEPAATTIGADDAERALFANAQTTLLAAAPELHAMLVIQGGSAWEAGAETILAAKYRSYLFDLIAGPDNWYLVRAAPGDRGIVCAALEVPSPLDQGPTLDWAARYAASANGRGPSRVGLANASPLDGLSPDVAREALATLVRAARLSVMAPADAVAEGLDPRSFATGHGRANRRRGESGEP